MFIDTLRDSYLNGRIGFERILGGREIEHRYGKRLSIRDWASAGERFVWRSSALWWLLVWFHQGAFDEQL